MKVIGLLLILVTTIFGRTSPLDEIPERNADDDAPSSQYYISQCAVSQDGTFMSTDGENYVVVDYMFQMEYNRNFNVQGLLQRLRKEIGNSIIVGIFSDLCQRRRMRKVTINESFDFFPAATRRTALSEVANTIQGLDTNPNYKSIGKCPTVLNSNNGCEAFSGGIKVFLHGRNRKLMVTEKNVVDSIITIIKSAMDSGDVATQVDGIEYLTFYSEEGIDQNDPDEQAAEEFENELKEDILKPNLVSGELAGQQHASSGRSNKLISAGWGVLGVSVVIIAAIIGYRYNRTNGEFPYSSELEVEDVLVDGVAGDEDREHPIEDSVEVVYD